MVRKELHSVQKKLLTLLTRHIEDPLTVRELQDKLGLSSTSVVAHHIRQLEKRGYLKRNPRNPSDYQVLGASPEKPITYLNLYGLAQCGPGGSLLDGNPLDRIPISTKLLSFSSTEAFMVKAKGDSMSPRIRHGDFVIARRSATAESGTVVVCVNDGEALIKKINKEKKQVILVSLNPDFEPFLASEDFHIEGVVKSVLSNSFD